MLKRKSTMVLGFETMNTLRIEIMRAGREATENDADVALLAAVRHNCTKTQAGRHKVPSALDPDGPRDSMRHKGC